MADQLALQCNQEFWIPMWLQTTKKSFLNNLESRAKSLESQLLKKMFLVPSFSRVPPPFLWVSWKNLKQGTVVAGPKWRHVYKEFPAVMTPFNSFINITANPISWYSPCECSEWVSMGRSQSEEAK